MTATLDAPAAEPTQAPASPRQVRRQLARVEGARLLRHPLIWFGLGLTTLGVILDFDERTIVLHRDMVVLANFSIVIAMPVWWAVNLATLRSRRHDTDPLYDASPTARDVRTQAHLLSVLWPAGLALVWTGIMLAAGVLRGGIWAPEPFDVLAVPALILLTGALGVASARLLPSGAAGFFASLVAGLLLMLLATVPSTVARLQPWADWGPYRELIELYPRQPGVHLVWVLGLATAVATVALLRTRFTWVRVGVLGVAAAAAAASAVVMVDPWDEAAVARLLGALGDPLSIAECDTAEGVTTCSPPAYAAWHDDWRGAVTGMLHLLPQRAQPDEPLRIVLSPGWLDKVITTLPGGSPEVHFFSSQPQMVEVGTVQPAGNAGTAAAGFGLSVASAMLDFGGPVEIDMTDPEVQEALGEDVPPGTAVSAPCTARGQAREVVAAFIAVASDPAWVQGLETTLAQQAEWTMGDELFVARDGVGEDLHRWSRSGPMLALDMLEHDRAATLRVIHDDWERWMDPDTSADELARAVGVAPVTVPSGPADRFRSPACP